MNNRETLEKANQAFSTGNYEELLTFCTEDTKWTYVGDRTLDGKEKVRDIFRQHIKIRHSRSKNIWKKAKLS